MSRAQQNSTGRPRKAPAVLGLGLAVVLGAAGCSAGQVTQTDSMPPAVNGNLGQVGPIAIRDAVLAFPHETFYQAGADAPLLLTIVNTGAESDQLLEVTSPLADADDVVLAGDLNLPGGTAIAVGTPGKEVSGTAGKSGHESSAAHATTITPTSAAPGSGSLSASGSATPSHGASEPHGSSAAHSTPSGSASAPAPTSAAPSSAKVKIGVLQITLKSLLKDVRPGQNVPVTFVFAKAGSITISLPFASPSTPRVEESEHGEGGH